MSHSRGKHPNSRNGFKKGHAFYSGTTLFTKGHITWNKGKKGLQKSPRKGKKLPQFSGKNNPNWQGGVTSLYDAIRTSVENKEWKLRVFAKDNYACQECGSNKSGTLEAHHLKRFALILKEFLQTYSQFSPIEDRETLARLAINYKQFWEIENGQTLCVDCHNLTKTKGE